MQQMWQNVDIVMADCGHLPPKKDECVQCLLDKIKSQQESIWELEEMVSDRELKFNSEKAVRHLAVQRLAGQVEGRLTSAGNFLQRIDELTNIEARVILYATFANDPVLANFANRMLKGDKS